MNLIAPLNQLGYGQVGIAVLSELSCRGISPAWWPPYGYQGTPEQRTQEMLKRGDILPEHAVLVTQAIRQTSYFKVDHPCVRIWHQFDMALFPGKGPRWGWPIFELNRFTEVERHQLRSLDGVIVCSEWAKNIVHQECGEQLRVEVVPLGVDREIFQPIDSPPTAGPTVFLTVGKWEYRKGHDILCKAFNLAFSPQDDVRLIMACSNPFLSEGQRLEWENYYKYSPLGEKISILPQRLPTQRDLARLMNTADCGVFLSRAEGWNLELLEMLSLGKAVIATNCPGHSAFITDYNSLIVELDEWVTAQDGIWFRGQGEWPTFNQRSLDQVVAHLRAVHQSKQNDGPLFNQRGINTAGQLTWGNTVNQLLEAIQ